jgi:hypothetical protein
LKCVPCLQYGECIVSVQYIQLRCECYLKEEEKNKKKGRTRACLWRPPKSQRYESMDTADILPEGGGTVFIEFERIALSKIRYVSTSVTFRMLHHAVRFSGRLEPPFTIISILSAGTV